MRNSRLLPYETIIKATSGEPEAVNTVLQHYRGLICYYSLVDGRVDRDTEDYITEMLLTALFKAYMKVPVLRPALRFEDRVFRSCGHTPRKVAGQQATAKAEMNGFVPGLDRRLLSRTYYINSIYG